MPSQFVRFEHDHAATVGTVLTPKFTEREAPILTDEISQAAQEGDWRVVLDLSEVTMLSSAGLGSLLTIHKACKKGGGRCVLFGLDKTIHGTLKITKLDRVFTIKKSRKDALKLFG